MRIDLNTGIGATETSLEKSGAGARTSGAAHNPPETEFSSKPESAATLTRTALDAPEVREQKVQSLRAQIRSGAYEVSASQIAGALLDSARRV